MIFSKIYICPTLCFLTHMFVVSMDMTVHEGPWHGPFALEDFRELQVLDGLSLYCYDKHFYEKVYGKNGNPRYAKSEFQIATEVPLPGIRELRSLANRFLESVNDIPVLEKTLLTAKYHSTLKRINFWYGACKNCNYNKEDFFTFFKNMAGVYEALLPKLREKIITEYYQEDALMLTLDFCTNGLTNNERIMLSSMLLLPARYTKIKTNPYYQALHDKLYNDTFAVLPFVRLFNMFLIEKYYQEKYPAVFAQLSQSHPITSSLDDYTVDEVACLQRLKVINLCILDLGQRIQENKIKYMEKLVEDGPKNQNNAFSDRWFMLKTKCKLLNEFIDKKGFRFPGLFLPPVLRFMMSPVLRFMISKLEDQNGDDTIKFAYPRSFKFHYCYVEFLDTLSEKMDTIGLEAYQKQKETLKKQLLDLDKLSSNELDKLSSHKLTRLDDELRLIFNIRQIEKNINSTHETDEQLWDACKNKLLQLKNRYLIKAIVPRKHTDEYIHYLNYFSGLAVGFASASTFLFGFAFYQYYRTGFKK